MDLASGTDLGGGRHPLVVGGAAAPPPVVKGRKEKRREKKKKEGRGRKGSEEINCAAVPSPTPRVRRLFSADCGLFSGG